MKKAILVLGPPRSGTSVISHIIHKLGVNFGKHENFVDPAIHKFNPIFFELQSLNDLNDNVFRHFSKKYTEFDWLPVIANFDELVISKFENEIESFIKYEFSKSEVIGLKDPRFCFTLPLWHAVLERHGYDVRYVLAYRQSDAVFSSNINENRYSREINFRIVAHSTVIAWQFLRDKSFVSVDYSELMANPVSEIATLCDALDVDNALCSQAASVVSNELNHQSKAVPLHYNYFEKVIDTDNVDHDAHLGYREIVVAATSELRDRNQFLMQDLGERDRELAGLTQSLGERDRQLVDQTQVLIERDRE